MNRVELDAVKLIAYARTWIGTPRYHNQCKKGVGVDCINFAMDCYGHFGLHTGDKFNYSRQPRGNSLLNYLASLNDIIIQDELSEVKPGQLLLLRVRKVPHHVAIAVDADTMIHANASPGIRKVIEEPIGKWKRRISAKYTPYIPI